MEMDTAQTTLCFICGATTTSNPSKHKSSFSQSQESYYKFWLSSVSQTFCQVFDLIDEQGEGINYQNLIINRLQKCSSCEALLRDLDFNVKLLVSLQRKVLDLYNEIGCLVENGNPKITQTNQNMLPELTEVDKFFQKLLEQSSLPFDFNNCFSKTLAFYGKVEYVEAEVEIDGINRIDFCNENTDTKRNAKTTVEEEDNDGDEGVKNSPAQELDPDYFEDFNDEDLELSRSDPDYEPDNCKKNVSTSRIKRIKAKAPKTEREKSRIRKATKPQESRIRKATKPIESRISKAAKLEESGLIATEKPVESELLEYKSTPPPPPPQILPTQGRYAVRIQPRRPRPLRPPMPCKTCWNIFPDKQEKDKHARQCYLKCPFPQCPINQKQPYDPLASKELENHVNTIHFQIDRLRCIECSKSWKFEKEMAESGFLDLVNNLNSHLSCHKLNEHKLQKYKCVIDYCNAGFFNSTDLKNHVLRVHEDPVVVNLCQICDKVFENPYYLFRHSRDYHGPVVQSLKCPEPDCGFECVKLGTLKDHALVHMKERPFLCDSCPKTYKEKKVLVRHQKRYHDPNPPERKYKCTFSCCNKAYFNLRSLRFHEESGHNLERNYICEMCSKTYKSKHGLNQHFRFVCKRKSKEGEKE